MALERTAKEIASSAKGEISPDDLKRSGSSGILSFGTGYPSKCVVSQLNENEQLNYLMENYTDGVNINGDRTSLSDDHRNFICITDSRVLIIIGGDEKDETFEYKLKRIIDSEFASGMVASDKLKFNSYNGKGSEDNVTFPVRGGSDGKVASQYISSKCKGMAAKAGKSRDNKATTTNRSSSNTSQSTPSTTGQKDGKKQIPSGRDKDNNNKKENESRTEERIHSLRSNLYKVDSLLTNAEYKQAKQQVDEIRSEISSLKEQASQKNNNSHDTELQRLEKKCDNRLSKSYVLSQLREVDPYDFEELVAKIWEKKGWEAEVTSGSADRGIDVIAIKEDTFEKRRHLIQVKRHGENSKVGSEDMQRYASLYRRDEQVDNVFVVTSNQFTSEAKETAENRDVSTVNGDELYEMLTET